jgi:hypothetical protein
MSGYSKLQSPQLPGWLTRRWKPLPLCGPGVQCAFGCKDNSQIFAAASNKGGDNLMIWTLVGRYAGSTGYLPRAELPN